MKNKSQIKESWYLLSDVVKDAHEMGLHLRKSPGVYSELETEIRRRLFGMGNRFDSFRIRIKLILTILRSPKEGS